jgi:hypothetical protein
MTCHTHKPTVKGTVLCTGRAIQNPYPYPCIPVSGYTWCYPYLCHALVTEDHPTGNRSKPTEEVSSHVHADDERTRATMDVVCYNCGEKGHKFRDCKRPHKPKVHLWAACTEIPCHSDNGEKGHKSRTCKRPCKPKVHLRAACTEIPCHSDNGRDMWIEDDEVHSKDTERDEGGESNEEIIEVEVPKDLYSNDFYEWEFSLDYMAPICIGAMEPNPQKRHPPMGEPIHDEHPV